MHLEEESSKLPPVREKIWTFVLSYGIVIRCSLLRGKGVILRKVPGRTHNPLFQQLRELRPEGGSGCLRRVSITVSCLQGRESLARHRF